MQRPPTHTPLELLTLPKMRVSLETVNSSRRSLGLSRLSASLRPSGLARAKPGAAFGMLATLAVEEPAGGAAARFARVQLKAQLKGRVV